MCFSYFELVKSFWIRWVHLKIALTKNNPLDSPHSHTSVIIISSIIFFIYFGNLYRQGDYFGLEK